MCACCRAQCTDTEFKLGARRSAAIGLPKVVQVGVETGGSTYDWDGSNQTCMLLAWCWL